MSAKVITDADFRRLESLLAKYERAALAVQSVGRQVTAQLRRCGKAIEDYKQVELPIDTKGRR